MSTHVCVYHRVDYDGICSAAICRYYNPEIALKPYNYGDHIDLREFRDRVVVMVDCAFPPDLMLELIEVAKEVVWLDHHETAIAAAKERNYEFLNGIRKIGTAGCELAWQFFFPDRPLPMIVRLLGRYDVWDHSDLDSLPAQAGVRYRNLTADTSWAKYFQEGGAVETERDILVPGRTIQTYKEATDAAIVNYAFPVMFRGMRFLAVNGNHLNSLSFKTVALPEFVGFIVFSWANDIGMWRFTLYDNQVNKFVNKPHFGEMAQKYGGGGHAGAAGFQVAGDPFAVFDERPETGTIGRVLKK